MSTLSDRLYKLAKAPAPFWAWEYAGRLLDLQPNAKTRAVLKSFREKGLSLPPEDEWDDLPGFPDRVEMYHGDTEEGHVFLRIHHKGKTYDFQGHADDFVDHAEETHFASWPPGKTEKDNQAKERLATRLYYAARKRKPAQFCWYAIHFNTSSRFQPAVGEGGDVALTTGPETPTVRLSDPNYHALKRRDDSDHFPLTMEQLTEQAYDRREHAEQLVEQENQELSKYGMRWLLHFGIPSRLGKPLDDLYPYRRHIYENEAHFRFQLALLFDRKASLEQLREGVRTYAQSDRVGQTIAKFVTSVEDTLFGLWKHPSAVHGGNNPSYYYQQAAKYLVSELRKTYGNYLSVSFGAKNSTHERNKIMLGLAFKGSPNYRNSEGGSVSGNDVSEWREATFEKVKAFVADKLGPRVYTGRGYDPTFHKFSFTVGFPLDMTHNTRHGPQALEERHYGEIQKFIQVFVEYVQTLPGMGKWRGW